MNDVIGRWARALGFTAFVCATLATGTGCGAIKAAANPKVAWALNDPAPMAVVVRRADVAEKTGDNVDRLMTDTPANDDSPWLAKVAPDKDEAKQQMTELRKNELYMQPVRVVAAEVWAKSLASIEPKDAKKNAVAAPAAAPSSGAPAAPAATPASDPAPDATADATPPKKSGKKGAGKKVAKNAKTKPRTNAKKPQDDASSASASPASSTELTSAPITPGDAAPAAAAKYASVLAAVDAGLGDDWRKVMEKKKASGELRGQIAALDAANDQKGISDADKTANKAKMDDLDKQAEALEKDAKQLSKDFVPKAKAAAQKTAPDVREKIGPMLVNLRQAVADANIANGAAAVRYTFALPSMLDSAKTMAKIYIADVVEEKTGKRPNMQTLQPGVTMDGGKVQVTINGLSSSDLGKTSIGEVTSEVASRTSKWVGHALGLLGSIGSTKEVLEFEDDVLGGILDGFRGAGWNVPNPATIPDAPPPTGAAPARS